MAGGTLISQKETKMQDLNSSTQPSWERQSNETSRAYRAFCIFRDFGSDRSLDKAYARFCEQHGRKSTRRPGHWSDWSTKYSWVERAANYDDWLDEGKLVAIGERNRKLEERRSLFALENQERMENHVRSADWVLESAFKTPLSKVTQTKIDRVTGTETVSEAGGLDMGGVAKFWTERNKTAVLAVKGVDAKELAEEERQVDRVVWVTAPEKVDSPKNPDSPKKPDSPKDAELDEPDDLTPGYVRPITELTDPYPEPEEKAA